MKKRFSRILLIAGAITATQLGAATSSCDCDCNFTSQTFFSARPQFQSGMPEKITLMRDRTDAREDGRGGAFQLAVFGGKSAKEEYLRQWFFPFCKDKLDVLMNANSNSTLTFEEMDVNAEHFRVYTQDGTFESILRMCPYQSVFGIGLTYRQKFSSIGCAGDDEERDYDWWFEISSPLMQIKNDLQLTEDGENDGGGVYETPTITGLPEDHVFMADMMDAFQQKAWKYGKICGCQTKWRLADIELKCGFEWLCQSEKCRMEAYLGVLVPTGNRPTAEFVFEPIVGHNGHWGITKGGAAYFQIWDNDQEDKHVQFTWDWHGMYLFKRNECRSFDVKCKPWSRYMSVYADIDQAKEAAALANVTATEIAGDLLDSPGINFFTKDLKVEPRLSFNTTTAIIYTTDERGFRGEVGYSLFTRQKECVSLCEWNETIAFRPLSGSGETVPYPYARIDTRGSRWTYQGAALNLLAGRPTFPGSGGTLTDREYEASIIKAEDLNLESAAHPAVFSHTFYLSLGKRWDDRDYPLFFGAGGSYEFGGTNAGMDRWLLWVKGGVSF